MGLFSRKKKEDRKQPSSSIKIGIVKERIIPQDFKDNQTKQGEVAEKMQNASLARSACRKKNDRDGTKMNEEIVESCKKELADLAEKAKALRNF